MSHPKSDLLTRVRSENLGRNFGPPLAVAGGILAVGLLLAGVTALFLKPPWFFHVLTGILAGTPLAAIVAAGVVYRFRREDRAVTAARIDREQRGMNRLEAAVELAHSDNPLKDDQAREAAGYYARRQPARWGLRLAMLGLLLAVLAAVDTAVLVAVVVKARAFRLEQAAAEAANHPAGQNVAAEVPAPREPDHAELLLTDPEPEIKAKPLEEITWKGAGASSHGFDRLELEIAINGQFSRTVTVVFSGPARPGEAQELNGAFALGDFGVEPFDLISYNLRGTTHLDGVADRRVTSLPQFIQITPFREDIEELRGGGAVMRNIMDEVLKWLRIEIAMNKASFAVSNATTPSGNAAIREQVGLLAHDQLDLATEVKTTAARITPEELPEELIANSLSAGGGMTQAADGLQATAQATGEMKPDTLDPVCRNQQRAIADLVSVLKAGKRMIIKDAEAAAKKEKDPFLDRTPKPPQDPALPSARTEKELARLRAAEADILNAMNPPNAGGNDAPAPANPAAASKSGQGGGGGSPGGAAPDSQLSKQEQITDGLARMKNASGQDSEMQAALTRGEESSAATEQALAANQTPAATAAAKKTLADLDAAAAELVKKSERAAAAAVADARRKLDAAKAGLEQGEPVAAVNGLKALDRLAAEARRQRESGTEARFREFSGLEARLRQDKFPELFADLAGNNRHPDKLRQGTAAVGRMDAELKKMQDGGAGPARALADGVKRLKESQNELDYLKKHPTGMASPDRDAATADARLAMRDTTAAIDALTQASPPGTPSGQSPPSPQKGQGQEQGQGQGSGIGLGGNGLGGGSGRVSAALYSHDVDVLLDGVKELRLVAERILAEQQALATVRVFNPDEAPKEYRGDVSRYFERLSERETGKP